MPIARLAAQYSKEKLDVLQEYYTWLFDQLRIYSKKWLKMCKFSRNIFSFPFILCMEMQMLCLQILYLFATEKNVETLSIEIMVCGRRIIEIQNNNYRELGYHASVILQDGGFTLQNLRKLYERNKATFYGKHPKFISHTFFEIPSSTGIRSLDRFLDLFRIQDLFLPEGFINAHSFLRYDECHQVVVSGMTVNAAVKEKTEKVDENGDQKDCQENNEDDKDTFSQSENALIKKTKMQMFWNYWNNDFDEEHKTYHEIRSSFFARYSRELLLQLPTLDSSPSQFNASQIVPTAPYKSMRFQAFSEFDNEMPGPPNASNVEEFAYELTTALYIYIHGELSDQKKNTCNTNDTDDIDNIDNIEETEKSKTTPT